MTREYCQLVGSPITNAGFYPIIRPNQETVKVTVRKPLPAKPLLHDESSFVTPITTPSSRMNKGLEVSNMGFQPSKSSKQRDQRLQLAQRDVASLLIPDESMHDAPQPTTRRLPLIPRSVSRGFDITSSANEDAAHSWSTPKRSFFMTQGPRDLNYEGPKSHTTDHEQTNVLMGVNDGDDETTPLPFLTIDEDSSNDKLPPISLTMKRTASRILSPRNQSQFDTNFYDEECVTIDPSFL